jgi:hypothetical protein
MSQKKTSERDAEHPFFRALVLMGGSLALSCGGSVVIDRSSGGGSSSTTSGGSANAGTVGVGGSTSSSGASGSFGAGGGINIGGGVSVGGSLGAGGSGITVAPSMSPSGCPWAQLDCSSLGSQCGYHLPLTMPTPGCVCNPKRPRSVADCAPNEDIVCTTAVTDTPIQTTNWDNSLHVQCSCIPGSTVLDNDTCTATCLMLFPGSKGQGEVLCSHPPQVNCDANGACTAVSDEVLHQEGITCGCAIVSLK